MKLLEVFSCVPDFRVQGRIKHKLSEILVLSLCGVLGGAEDFEEIESFGYEKEELLRSFLELENGIPSHDTINRVFRFLDPKSFGDCLYSWSSEIIASLKDLQINIDGKVLRGSGERGKRSSGLCLVSAWVAEHCLSLGQVKVAKKSNEKTAIPAILEDLDLKDKLVSIDAIGTHQKFAEQILGKQGNYLLALKKNQKDLYTQVSEWMQKSKESLEFYSTEDLVGGRIESREIFVSRDLSFMEDLEKWPDCQSVIMVNTHRSFKSGKEQNSQQTRFYISSAELSVEDFAKAIRSHWSIENQMH